MTQLLPPKKDVALALLERSNVDVYLDPRSEGVVVPPQFRKEPRLILKIGLNMHVPIPDLRVDDDSMSCTLSFSRTPFYCIVPWSSVFAMVGEDGRGMVWPDDVPQELAVKSNAPPKGVGPTAVGPAKEGAKVALAPALPASETREPLRSAGGRSPRRSKLADASAPSSTGKNKRTGKKKKDEGRPVLMAVPPPAPSAPVLMDKSSPSSRGQTEKRSPSAETSEALEASKVPAEKASSPDATHPLDDVAAKPFPREATREGAREPAPAHAQVPNSSPGSSQPRPSGPGSHPNGPGSGRPKRELPPYLRVVK